MSATIANTYGAVFLGTIGSSILYGVTLVQAYIYYVGYPNDWQFQKIFVGLVIILDTLHLSMTVHAIYVYLIIDFGVPQTGIVWSIKAQNTSSVLVVMLVQSLYALRIWKIGRPFGRLWPTLIATMVVLGYAIAFVIIVEVNKTSSWTDLKAWPVKASFICSTIGDVVLSIAMCYYINKSRTAFTSTNNRLVTVMHFVLISGFFTSACSLAALITYITMPGNFVFLGLNFILSKVYITSYMAMLNARRSGREQESTSVNGTQLSKLRVLRETNIQTTGDKDLFPFSTIGLRSQPSDEEKFTGSSMQHDANDKPGVI